MKGILVFIKFILLVMIIYSIFYHYDEVLYEAENLIRNLSNWLMTTVKSLIH